MLHFIFFIIICGIEATTEYFSLEGCAQAPGISGMCSKNQTKWTFVRHFGCYSFQYSGCGGNMNKFATKEECLNTCQGELVTDTNGHQPHLSEISGGSFVNNVDKFPWFAFIKITFPHFTWRIWDPDTKTERLQHHNTKQELSVKRCSGIWISPKRVLTADHCLFWPKPRFYVQDNSNEDPKQSEKFHLWRNIITDKSTYKEKKNGKVEDIARGQLSNVAIKLYGLTWNTAHPLDGTQIGNGVNQPPWKSDNTRAFVPVAYHPQFGGVEKARDIAVLELHRAVTDYFQPRMANKVLDLDKAFNRLQWAQDGANEPLKDEVIFSQLGCGVISETDLNLQIRLKRTNDLVYTSKKDCEGYLSAFGGVLWTWNDDWFGCYKSKSQDGARGGDSGGPGLSLVSASEDPPEKTVWRLHTILSTGAVVTGRESFVSVLVGNRKNEILGKVL